MGGNKYKDWYGDKAGEMVNVSENPTMRKTIMKSFLFREASTAT